MEAIGPAIPSLSEPLEAPLSDKVGLQLLFILFSKRKCLQDPGLGSGGRAAAASQVA